MRDARAGAGQNGERRAWVVVNVAADEVSGRVAQRKKWPQSWRRRLRYPPATGRNPRPECPTPRGVCASPTILNPTSAPPADPVASTAGSGCASETVAGSRIVAPRGTRLINRTLFVSVTRSRYSPGSTTISDPGRARLNAALIDWSGADHLAAWAQREHVCSSARPAAAPGPSDTRRSRSSPASR